MGIFGIDFPAGRTRAQARWERRWAFVLQALARCLTSVLVGCMTGCLGWSFEGEGSEETGALGARARHGDRISGVFPAPTPACDPILGWDAGALRDAVANGDDAPAELPRIVAIGDLHGSLAAAVGILKEAGLVNDQGCWQGGDTILVQVGDQIDRGDQDRAVIDLFESLREEAALAGGAVISMTGNHEVMNVKWDFGWVSDASFEGFGDISYDAGDPELAALPEATRGRAAAMRPGGPYAHIFASRPVVLRIGRTLFSHAGIYPTFADVSLLEYLNRETRAWMRGRAEYPLDLNNPHSPIWSRDFGGEEEDEVNCDAVDLALEVFCVDRMIVGHTIQDEINAACGGKLLRIDVGMYQGNVIAALEIVGEEIRVIEAPFPDD